MDWFDKLIEDLNERIENTKDYIAYNNCKDFYDYKYAVGSLKGFQLALDLIKEARKKEMDEDDDL